MFPRLKYPYKLLLLCVTSLVCYTWLWWVKETIEDLIVGDDSVDVMHFRRGLNLSKYGVVNHELNIEGKKDHAISVFRHPGKIRILCFSLTSHKNIEDRGWAVQATWAKRCDEFLFASEGPEPGFPSMNISVKSGRDSLYNKTTAALEYVHAHHPDYDWILKTDDDTYIVMENLREMLRGYSPDEGIMFGDPLLQKYGKKDIHYFSGGGGYVMSSKALEKFAVNHRQKCKPPYAAVPEDAMVAMCMKKLKVTLGSMQSCDSKRRTRFHALDFQIMLRPDGGFMPWWYKNFSLCYTGTGPDHLSDESISFHYMSPLKMIEFEFILYKLAPKVLPPAT